MPNSSELKEFLKKNSFKESPIFLNSILRRVPVCIGLFDVSGKCLHLNKYFRNQLEITSKEAERLTLKDLLAFQCHKKCEDCNDKICVNENELKYVVKSGQTKWFKINVFKENSPLNGEVIVFVASDITSNKLALQKSQQAESTLNSIYDNVFEGIYRKNSSRLITHANDSFLNLFGIKDYRLQKINFRNLYSRKSSAELVEDKLDRQGFLKNEKIRFKKLDGTEFWGLVSVKKITIDGQLYFNGAIIDITSEIERDQQLKQKNTELEKAREQLDRLIYSASHDLRSPISSIFGLVNILETDTSSRNDLMIYLKMIKESLHRLNGVVNGINLYAQTTRKRKISESINLEDLLKVKFNDLKEEYGFTPLLEINSTLEDYPFYSDKYAIEVICSNIIDNTFRFAAIDKRTPKISIDLKWKSDFLIMSIYDNGIGIPKAHIEKAFNMFYTAHQGYSGVGLGLYITKEAVKVLGGSIKLSSSINKGTNVIVKIPNGPKGRLISKKIKIKTTK